MGKKLNLAHISLIKTFLLSNYASFTETQSLTSTQKSKIKSNLGITDPPTTYIKNATISGGILTLTKQDNTTVTYSYDDSSIKSRLTTIENAYIKSASVSNGILTLTLQNGSTISYKYDDSSILSQISTINSTLSAYETRIASLESKLAAITLEV